MKRDFIRRKIVLGFIGISLFMGLCITPKEVCAKSDPFDIVIQINQLDQAIKNIESLDSTGQAASLLQGILHGTRWIDPGRSIVLSLTSQASKPKMMALIPFAQPNPEFVASTHARSGPNYYYLALPPGSDLQISPRELKALETFSSMLRPQTIAISLNPSKILQKNRSRLDDLMQKLDTLPSPPPTAGTQAPLDPNDLKKMATSFLDTFGELKHLLIGFDLDAVNMTFSAEAEPLGGSKLATLLKPVSTFYRMQNYTPPHPVMFKSRSYRTSAAMDLIEGMFGGIYRNMGIDFSSLMKIMDHFTGELAGGMSMDKNGLKMEFIMVLSPKTDAKTFLETQYVPWMMEYNKSLTAHFKKNGITLKPILKRTPDTTVDGLKVIGMQYRFPEAMYGQDVSLPLKNMLSYNLRMTVWKDMLLTASDDKTLKRLIVTAKSLKPGVSSEPQMVMEFDLSAFAALLNNMLPDHNATIPSLGKFSSQFDIKDGRFLSRSTIKVDDLKKMAASLKKITSTAKGRHKNNRTMPPQRNNPQIKSQVPSKSPPPLAAAPKKPLIDAAFWYNKGALASAYGGEKSAVRHYDRALKLAPENSQIYFQKGISLAELGHFTKALTAINKAISIDPENGMYYYGRGRTHLMAENRKAAFSDFEKAAALENPKAKAYLKLGGNAQ